MAIQITKVKPGEIITSDFINSFIDTLQVIDTRISALETASPGGGAPIIVSLSPDPTEVNLKMGDELRIVGKNLGTSTLVSVTVDKVDVKQYKQGSSDSLLIVDIPTILGITDVGKDVDLVVTNLKGYDIYTFHLYPGETTQLSATLTVTNTVVPTTTIVGDGVTAYSYTFVVSTLSSLAEVYTLKPAIDKTGWVAKTYDENDKEITEVSIPKSQPTPSDTTIIVKVTIPTGQTGTGNLSLGLVAKHYPTISGYSGTVPITLGSTPTPVDDSFTFDTPVVIPNTAMSNGQLSVKSDGSKVTYRLTVHPKVKGDYLIATPTIQNNTGGIWKPVLKTSPATFTTIADGEPKLIIIDLTAGPDAPQTTMTVTVTKATDDNVKGAFIQPIKLA